MNNFLWGCLILFGIWLWEHSGPYLHWMSGCLLSVLLIASLPIALPLLYDFLINI
jgi:hypothetical protein